MMRSLYTRLIVSHVLPVMVVVPIMAAVLVYVLETQVVLTSIADELSMQAELLAHLAASQPDIWNDQAEANAFVTRFGSLVQARIAILDANGYLIVSNATDEQAQVGSAQDIIGLAQVLDGGIYTRISTESYLYAEYVHYQESAEVAEVMAPVWGANQRVVGIIRLTSQIGHVHERFKGLRLLIVGTLLIALVLSVSLGWVLARDLARQLHQATQMVELLTSGVRLPALPKGGLHEIRRLLLSVDALSARLNAVEEARRQLLANLVHELGRPLGALRSAIQALRGGAHKDPVLGQELLLGMDEEIGRLERLLDDLAHLYDQAVGKAELNYQQIPLAEWLVNLLVPWREAAQARGLRWQTEIPQELPMFVADPDRLAQALGNLLSNATKYTPSGGSITVSAGTDNGKVWIEVRDTGIGIDPDELEAIFEPFYRGQRTHHLPRGMGLGLTIARDLVTAHGGTLEVHSTPGHGSRFVIRLPLQKSQQLIPHLSA